LTVGSVRDHCKKKTRGGTIFSPRVSVGASVASPPTLGRAAIAHGNARRRPPARLGAQFSLALHQRVGKLLYRFC
jgi:hypothetical protein